MQELLWKGSDRFLIFVFFSFSQIAVLWSSALSWVLCPQRMWKHPGVSGQFLKWHLQCSVRGGEWAVDGGCRVVTSSVLGAEKHPLSILSLSRTRLPLSLHCHPPSSSPPFPPLLHPSLYSPFYHSFIPPLSLVHLLSTPLPPFLPSGSRS